MPRTRIPVPKFPIGRCTWQKFEPSERVAFLEKTLKAKHGVSSGVFQAKKKSISVKTIHCFQSGRVPCFRVNHCGQCMPSFIHSCVGLKYIG
jgi:hypothetical protein